MASLSSLWSSALMSHPSYCTVRRVGVACSCDERKVRIVDGKNAPEKPIAILGQSDIGVTKKDKRNRLGSTAVPNSVN